MFLGFIAGYINKYIGAYFEDIDVSQLTGSLLLGGVTLHDLNLRPTIMESLGLPFYVVAGKCGTLEIKYSIYRLYTDPVVVKLKDLHVLMVPSRGVHYDPVAEKAALQQDKLRQLEVYDSLRHHMVVAEEELRSSLNPAKRGSVNQEATYFDIWVMQILRNIKFQIESVHVRFEDDITKPKDPFSVGVTIKDLEVHTTDSSWNSQYVKDNLPETLYKLISINGFSAYWNPAPTVMYKGMLAKDKKKLFEQLAAIPSTINKDPTFKTLFGPLPLVQVKISITVLPELMKKPFSKPRVRIETSMDMFFFTVSDKQIKDIIPFTDTIDILIACQKYRKYRPQVKYRGHAKAWWRFAWDCIMDDISRRRNNFRWEHIREHRKNCRKYLKFYYKKKVLEKSGSEIDNALSKLEEELDLFNIVLLRRHVELIQSRKNRSRTSIENQEPGYVSTAVNWLWSWVPPISPLLSPALPALPPPPPPTPPPAPKKSERRRSLAIEANIFDASELTREDKMQLRAALTIANNIDIINCPVDYVDFETKVILNQLRIVIYKAHKNERTTVLDAVLENVSIAFLARLVNDGMLVELKVGRIDAFGGDLPKMMQSRQDFFAVPQLLTIANTTSHEYFLKIAYEKAPLDSEVDHRISLEGLALQFTYHAYAIERIIDCFDIPKKGEPKILGSIPAATILRKVFSFQKVHARKLLKVIENQGRVELNLCLISPYVVIPQYSKSGKQTTFCVMQLGEINLLGTVVGGTFCEDGLCSSIL